MYRYLAIANYEDRFVIPTSHRELAEDAFPERNGCGFTFGDGCHGQIRNSTCLTAGGSTPSTSAACVSMGRASDADPESDRSAAGVPRRVTVGEPRRRPGADQGRCPSLTPFVGELLTAPLLDRQAEWCEVFERGRATSLLLFEHVHAESRDRGQAMVDLMNQYQQAVCRSIVASCPTICRCIWSISVFYLPRRLGRGCRISRRFWR